MFGGQKYFWSNAMFGLRGPGSIPVLDLSQKWSLHVTFTTFL